MDVRSFEIFVTFVWLFIDTASTTKIERGKK